MRFVVKDIQEVSTRPSLLGGLRLSDSSQLIMSWPGQVLLLLRGCRRTKQSNSSELDLVSTATPVRNSFAACLICSA